MNPIHTAFFLGISAVAAIGPGTVAAAQPSQHFVAQVAPLNTEKVGTSAKGTATFDIAEGQLTITVDAEGLTPGMHLQHYHGFPEGRDATCPAADADTNGDGLIDLIETEPMAGTTMVPFHANPASLTIANDTYPEVGQDGSLHYEQTVSVDDLEKALQEKFGVSELALEDRVVFLHGVGPNVSLPDTAQSLPDVPAHVTLPVACGTIEAVD
ncbi:hypothetical protein GCM10027040_00470 [Halomonas shantousis]